MGYLFQVNDNMFYQFNPFYKKNPFLTKEPDTEETPGYLDSKEMLPKPYWKGHENYISCYDRTWQLAFYHLEKANKETGFVSNFIDTAFNGYLFMWDSSFIVMFGKYGSRVFNFQKTLDNFYSHQHKDGFICREICEKQKGEQFHRDDPVSTGPNILPWAEWEYYLSTGDKDRLSKVFYPLLGYHLWLQNNRSWPDGTYWSCGLACGMDNQPRQDDEYDSHISHGFMSWIDACAQMYLSGSILQKMNKELGNIEDLYWLEPETKMLKEVINNKMWDEKTAFYYDTRRDGKVSGVKSIGAYWTLLAGLVPEDRKDRFVAHLDNENEFKRPNRIPTLSYDDSHYRDNGAYWRGGVWAPTNYMTLTALHNNGYDDLAFDIASTYLKNVVEVFDKTNTVWENYAPESANPGDPAMKDFVGWTGLAPISIMFEFVFGIKTIAQENTIVWNVNLLDEFGIDNYPFRDGTLNLRCEKRTSKEEEPKIKVEGNVPVKVILKWNGNEKIIDVK